MAEYQITSTNSPVLILKGEVAWQDLVILKGATEKTYAKGRLMAMNEDGKLVEIDATNSLPIACLNEDVTVGTTADKEVRALVQGHISSAAVSAAVDIDTAFIMKAHGQGLHIVEVTN